ncbi:MAG: glycerol-3-phosphate dehydrogenase (NAD(P)(+)), partial [Gammaproteobacteria bacterium]|nr:glycerol-3-phosphate dehydrogenase (NAD(P)(+)) [Gammaproteobacteria bacterium]
NEALKVVGATVEGLNALKIVISIANKVKIEMPICNQVLAVTEGKIKPADAVKELLLRKPVQE